MAKQYNLIDDGFHPELVEQAFFDGNLEIPCIKPPNEIIVPQTITPFSKRRYTDNYNTAICEYEHDVRFAQMVYDPEIFIEEIKKYTAFISPDCSLYRDMPLCLQIANTYLNRAVGSFYQSKGIYVIPNIRWGDERTYSTSVLPEKVAFLGVSKKSIVSIGTYGCIRGSENRYFFKSGLDAMLQELEPLVVLVYGSMPNEIFKDYESGTAFVQYDDWTTRIKKEKK